MFIIVFTMIYIVATIINIVFAKIGNVLRPMDRQIKVKRVKRPSGQKSARSLYSFIFTRLSVR